MNRYNSIRIGLCVACIVVFGLVIFNVSWWVSLVVSMFGVAGVLAALFISQFLLPLLLPKRKWLLYGASLYFGVWIIVWCRYHFEVTRDPLGADDRGLTGGLFIYSNIMFVTGLGMRLAAQLACRHMVRQRIKNGENAV